MQSSLVMRQWQTWVRATVAAISGQIYYAGTTRECSCCPAGVQHAFGRAAVRTPSWRFRSPQACRRSPSSQCVATPVRTDCPPLPRCPSRFDMCVRCQLHLLACDVGG